MLRRLYIILSLIACLVATAGSAQELGVSTVTRPPFSMLKDDDQTGFSMDLMAALAEDLGWTYGVQRYDQFTDMLNAVTDGTADLAIANISITAQRETLMDFSQPIFESGLQIMIPADKQGAPSLMRALMSRELFVAIGIAFGLLLTGGMLMWYFERRSQPYFDRNLNDAWFPSFWWALNLVVNGGFEERVPRTSFGKIFGVVLVVSSLFVVSVFTARITSVMTVEAITNSVSSVNDLYGRRVATIQGSTAATFLDRRDLNYTAYDGLGPMLADFEAGSLDAVVFDAPILSYYTSHEGTGVGVMTGAVFLRENYGIAFPTGSPLVEEVNQALLTLRENGTYDTIYRKWFGTRN
ncbi:transporter substrate-binding domain-containing protein [Ruegeria sp. 2205SS24-7]|uniref:transporter substrate-binding domain-containing protein n=1 Tax=Ruegeria discodermiae TaxID=3064389 RepID=UPI0027413FD5|nr:transporter substrate-binding domain-containing protein [Ruegeria sp. 2205SS24-7]MDP5218314.1 transporter substrate-binding domain-containing protein [Ruegeria sp. 2205SS24-7]